MRTYISNVTVTGLLMLVTLILGLSLSRNLRLNDPRASGKPLAGTVSAVHKLAALATVVAAAWTIRNLHRGIAFTGIEVSVIFFTGILFLLMFISGSLLSLGKAPNEGTQAVHKAAAFLTVFSTAGAIYLLTRGRP